MKLIGLRRCTEHGHVLCASCEPQSSPVQFTTRDDAPLSCDVFQRPARGGDFCATCGRTKLLHRKRSAWTRCVICDRGFKRAHSSTVTCSDFCKSLLRPVTVALDERAVQP